MTRFFAMMKVMPVSNPPQPWALRITSQGELGIVICASIQDRQMSRSVIRETMTTLMTVNIVRKVRMMLGAAEAVLW